MNINYYNPYVREELMLYHHGVLGQRWGKKNGPPYPLAAGDHSASEKKAGWIKSLSGMISEHRRRKADRKSAGSDLSTKKDKNNKTVNTNNADANNTVDETTKRYIEVTSKASKIVDEYDIASTIKMEQLNASDNPKDKKRVKDAADLGIKALDRIEGNAADDINNITDSDRERFMFDYQNIGLGQVADMVNRGKSKDQVKSALKAAMDVADYDFFDDPHLSQNQSNSIMDLQEFAIREKRNDKSFVDACYEVKAERDKSNKENAINKNASLAKSMYRSGKSYAEIAKRLGISESNVQYLLSRK